jgi:SAM-dependent MidA family methyltransferase
VIVNPGGARAAQAGKPEPWKDAVRWVRGWSEFRAGFRGVIFANELLDSFPVRRFGWDAAQNRWFEWGVTIDSETRGLGWCRLPAEAPLDPAQMRALGAVLPDGFVVERCPAAEAWWREAAEALGKGWLMTPDYGFGRSGGRLRPESQNDSPRLS